MLVLDHDRAGGYWGAVYVFTAIKGLQVVIDGPVGCENLPVTAVLHYTDALPPHELPVVVTGLAEEELGRHGTEGAMKRAHADARSRSTERGRHRLHRRNDRRRRDAGRHGASALPSREPSTRTSGRAPIVRWRGSGASSVRRKAARPRSSPGRPGAKPRVNIIGPSLRHVQHALGPRRDPAPRSKESALRSTWSSRSGAMSKTSRAWRTPRSTSASIANSGGCCARRSDRPYLQAPIGLHSTTKFLRSLGELAGLDPEPFIEREKHTTIKPVWDLWRSVTQDFFGTATFAIVANETYARGRPPFPRGGNGAALSSSRSRAVPAKRRTTRPFAARCARRRRS